MIFIQSVDFQATFFSFMFHNGSLIYPPLESLTET